MCLSIKVNLPDHVLAEGTHAGYEWIVTHSGMGFRCGYVRVPNGHPWHGRSYQQLYDDGTQPNVHGGLTFSEPDVECHHGGEDNAHWFGFDCNHSSDAIDPSLPDEDGMATLFKRMGGGTVRTQEYVEAECRSLCEQAAEAAK